VPHGGIAVLCGNLVPNGAVLKPSTVVGGDFYDIIPVGQRVSVALGDVSGLPDRLGSSLLELLNKKDDKRRPAAIRDLLEELARE